jgi:Tol biopolymer transport system component
VLFDSDRGGRLQIWTINTDGSGLHQVTDYPGFVANATLSPDGSRAIAFRILTDAVLMFDPTVGADRQRVERLPDYPGGFQPSSWSRDGLRVVGQVPRQRGGIVIYSVSERTFRRLTESGRAPRWLPDGRRVLYTTGSELRLLDSSTGTNAMVLGLVGEVVGGYGLSQDASTVFATISKPQSDVVIARLTSGTF